MRQDRQSFRIAGTTTECSVRGDLKCGLGSLGVPVYEVFQVLDYLLTGFHGNSQH